MAKLNIQGMSRSDKLLMECMVSDEGYETVSMDVSAGEPSVIMHYSQDARYKYACLLGVGKKPMYENGILMCDDIYLMSASVSPVGAEAVREAFDRDYDGKSFAELWVEDKDLLLKLSGLKTVRKFHKTMVLALQYGQRPSGMVKNARQNGYKLSKEDATKFWNRFWFDLFPDVKKLNDRLSLFVKKNKYLINEFGYRLVPVQKKAMNYYIQSSVSGLIDLYAGIFFSSCPEARFKAIIHDELVFDIPKGSREEVEKVARSAEKQLNDHLGWSVKLRFGFAVGDNHFEAK